MSSIVNLETSGQTIERRAILTGMYLDDKRQEYTIHFQEQLLIDGEIVSRVQHKIIENGEKWEQWNATLGEQLRPFLEADIKSYFTPAIEEPEIEEPPVEEPEIEEPSVEEPEIEEPSVEEPEIEEPPIEE